MRGTSFVSFGVAAALLAGQSSVSHAQEILELDPSSPWVVDYDDESCALRREFGGPDNPVVLQLRQFVPDREAFSIQVVGPNLQWSGRPAARLLLRFLPDEESSERFGVVRISAAELGHGVTFHSSLTPPTEDDQPPTLVDLTTPTTPEERAAFAARAQQVTGIEVSHAFTQVVRLNTRSLGNPMQAMSACLDELLTHWGVDVEAHRTLQRKAAPLDRRGWALAVQRAFPRVDYAERADLTVRLDVSASGEVTGCHLQQNIGDDAFLDTACRQFMRYGRLAPALDAQGQPIASYLIQTVLYNAY